KFALLLLPLTPLAAAAQHPPAPAPQLRWLKARRLGEQLPYSINVYLTQDSVHGRPFRACYVEIDPYDQKLDFTARVGEGKPSDFFESSPDPKPYVIVNGPQYDSALRRNLQL